jgi:hypothetical protein
MLRHEPKNFGLRVACSFADRMLALRNPLVTFSRMKYKAAVRILQPGTIAPVLALEKSTAVMKITFFCKP